MSTNKLVNIQQWRVLDSAPSTPEVDYIKIYPKSDGNWYSISSDGVERRISRANTFKNGLLTTSLGGLIDSQIDVVLGTGLTFSGDFSGSAIQVFGLTAYHFATLNSPSDGYILSVTGSSLQWVSSNTAVVSGTTNSIPKFTGVNSIGNSQIVDSNGTVYIGTAPSIVTASFSVSSNSNFNGYIYLGDNSQNSLIASSGVLFSTNNRFVVNYNTGIVSGNYFSFNTQTASIYNGLIEVGTSSIYYVNLNVNSVNIGTSSISSILNVYSSTSGAFRLSDTTQGLYKFLVSDANGIGTWQLPYGYNGLTTSGIGFGVNSGYGLTVSNGALIFNNLIIGAGLTVSTVGTVSLPLTGVVSGTYGSTNSTPVITVDSYGRITNISATATSGSGGSSNVYMSPYDKNWSSLSVSYGTASLSTLSRTPIQGSYVSVFINGQEVQVGNATTSAPCWFGTQSNSPKGFSSSNAISSGDYLYWNATQSGYNLESGFKISVHYLTSTL